MEELIKKFSELQDELQEVTTEINTISEFDSYDLRTKKQELIRKLNSIEEAIEIIMEE